MVIPGAHRAGGGVCVKCGGETRRRPPAERRAQPTFDLTRCRGRIWPALGGLLPAFVPNADTMRGHPDAPAAGLRPFIPNLALLRRRFAPPYRRTMMSPKPIHDTLWMLRTMSPAGFGHSGAAPYDVRERFWTA